MNKIVIKNDGSTSKRRIKMRAMRPLTIGRIVENNYIVMRTASEDTFEVMNLSDPGVNHCLTDIADIVVELLPDAKLIVEL